MMEEDLIIAFLIAAVVNLAQTVLLVASLNKAGFAGKWVLAGFTPVLALVGQSYLVFAGILTPTEAVTLCALLWLLPYLILAFKSWPVAAKHALPSET